MRFDCCIKVLFFCNTYIYIYIQQCCIQRRYVCMQCELCFQCLCFRVAAFAFPLASEFHSKLFMIACVVFLLLFILRRFLLRRLHCSSLSLLFTPCYVFVSILYQEFRLYSKQMFTYKLNNIAEHMLPPHLNVDTSFPHSYSVYVLKERIRQRRRPLTTL